MSLTAGTRIGPYEIVSALGAGGMGEVFRARDTKLNRDVAIKVLPDNVAADSERLARFEREAQTLAAVNHSRIAQIYGVIELGTATERDPGTVALVMEFVAGEDLAQRLTRGPIPLDDAVTIARQIAEGLEAAHERGIVHRDLKPANVKVTPDGSVKLLDFGLAKAAVSETSSLPATSNSPTFTSPVNVTQAGSLLGTAPYLAPEQVRGKPADRRADIWAFGCVLFEMLAGQPPFRGESMADVLGAIVRDQPRLDDLPASTPQSIRTLLSRCLTKDPARRLRDIGEARIALEDQMTGATDAGHVATQVVATRPPRALRWLAITSGVLALLLAIAAVRLWRTGPAPSAAPIVRFDVLPPAKASLRLDLRPVLALSPDGSTLAYAATIDGIPRLYIRARDSVESRALPGTEGGSMPTFSPDGKWIAFFADGKIKKVALDGPSVTVANAPDVRGIAWLDDHTLIFPPAAASALVSMSADGGETRPVSTLAPTERTHRWPDVLPGGKAVIFTVGSPGSPDNYDDATIQAVILATGERRLVWRGAAMARYSRSGHLILSRGPSLYAVPFDPERLTTTATPTQVVPAVERDVTTGAAHFASAVDGTLAIVPGSIQSGLFRLVWVDKQGATQPIDLPPAMYHEFRISPDGTRVALLNGPSGSGDIWIYDFVRHTNTRLTFTASSAAPVWSADGKTIFYTSIDPSGRASTVYRKPVDGSREADAIATAGGRSYLAWLSNDGSDAVLDFVNPGPGMADVVRMPLRPQAQMSPLVADAADTYGAAVSPDGRWVAYHSDESGRSEIYVRDLTPSGGRWQVSTSGGEEPHWSKDGRELYFRSENRMMVAPVDSHTSFQAGMPRLLFEGVYNLRSDTLRSYDVDPATGRFLMIRPLAERPPPSIRITLHWFDELRRLVGGR
jgi:serine/threonine-protein kinase